VAYKPVVLFSDSNFCGYAEVVDLVFFLSTRKISLLRVLFLTGNLPRNDLSSLPELI
jgi:hypothetical protein